MLTPYTFMMLPPPPLLQSEEIQRARKVGPYPRWVIPIPSMPETQKTKKARVMTAEEEALLQTLQNKKMRSRVEKEPINPLLTNIQGSSTWRPYPIFSDRRSQSPRSPVSQEPAYNTPINLTLVQLSRQS